MANNCTLNFISFLENYESNVSCIQKNLKFPFKSNHLILVVLIIVFVIVFITTFYCFKKSWNLIFSSKQTNQSQDEVDLELFNNLDSFQYLFSKFQHLEYPYNKLIFIRDIGDGEFGRVVQAKAPKLNSINNNRQADFTTINMMNSINNNNDDDYTVVAVKMLKKNEQRKFLKQNLIKEAYLMATFNHPNLIQLLGISITPQEHIYLLFEYMSKGDLNSFLIFRGPSNQLSSANFRKECTNLSELSLLNFAKQIADGMKYLSNLGFVHCDLSTRNCLINDDLIVKISDFGLSRKLTIDQGKGKDVRNFKRGGWSKIKNDEDEKLIKNEKLPIRWLPPESLLFDHFSIQSDIWAFGIVLWELFSFAKKPYSEISENRNVIKYICDGNRLDKPNLATKSIYNLMKKCWHKHPDKRPSFDKILNTLKQIEIEFIKKEKKAIRERQKSLKKNVRSLDDQTDKELHEENV